ncbi:DUF885 family protein [Alteromonas sediminis]|nr:DUF885 family protein [Alteromonas sediminis]
MLMFVSIGNAWALPSNSDILSDIEDLHLHRTEMRFGEYIERLQRQDLTTQQDLIQQLTAQFALTAQDELDECRLLSLEDARFALSLAKERLALTQSNHFSDLTYNGNFSAMQDGQAWYAHWLKSWLQSSVSTAELEKIALAELEEVAKKREELKRSNKPGNNASIKAADKPVIINAFKQRENTVYAYTESLLGSPYRASAINIVESNLPKSFPAPGIYNTAEQEFIYHLHTDNLPVKHMDWLFLHEAVPGHHYFSQYALHEATCPALNHLRVSTLFTEGWAAYVETLGEQLGLYNDTSSLSYALDWQAMRAVRVLLDVGIHTKGWDDKKAQAVWMAHIPEQQPIMQREIDRIRRWPVQVITYVYGKAIIEETISAMRAKHPNLSIAEIHRLILDRAPFSLNALSSLRGH